MNPVYVNVQGEALIGADEDNPFDNHPPMHVYCGGLIQSRVVTAHLRALSCHACNFRILVPIRIGTLRALGNWFEKLQQSPKLKVISGGPEEE